MKLEFFTSSSGRKYAEVFINHLSLDERGHILGIFEDIKQYGFSALGCRFRQIEGKLWEIKIETKGGGYRFFYVMLSGEMMMVLHAYRKQGQRAPRNELEVAKKRMKEVLL